MTDKNSAQKTRWAIGLMSGTSLDGIDAALLCVEDGFIKTRGAFLSFPYDDDFRAQLRETIDSVSGRKRKGRSSKAIRAMEEELTRRHAAAVFKLLGQADKQASEIDVIGFHGQTILHHPPAQRAEQGGSARNGQKAGWTWQLGDGAMLAELTGIDVANDFRSADMAKGGQGAPLAPLYHQAMITGRVLRLNNGILNIGGVANVTTIASAGVGTWIKAFDVGPGNALIDDWMQKKAGQPFDENGATAARGHVDGALLAKWLDNDFFTALPPKSLDRNAFKTPGIEDLSLEDGAANLTAFTAAAIQMAVNAMEAPPEHWYVTGGGRHNATLMNILDKVLVAPVEPVERIGLNGDAIEAEAFAWLGLRVMDGLPISLPETTGTRGDGRGGVVHKHA